MAVDPSGDDVNGVGDASPAAADSGLIRHLRKTVRDANRQAAEDRRRADELRGPAVRGLIGDLGITDAKHVAALARLHDGEVTREAVAETISSWSEVFGAPAERTVDDR